MDDLDGMKFSIGMIHFDPWMIWWFDESDEWGVAIFLFQRPTGRDDIYLKARVLEKCSPKNLRVTVGGEKNAAIFVEV